MGYLHPDAEASIRRREQERRERIDGTRPLFDSAYTKGDFRLAEPGCEVWSKVEGNPANVRMNPYGDPRGGIILEVSSDVDDQGEIRRAFRCLDYTLGDEQLWRGVVLLQESMVEPSSFSAPDWNRIKRTWRRLCRQVGKKLDGRHEASVAEIDMVRDAARLAAIVGQTLA